ncbi:MAG TPA: hypothetical protein VG433_04655 [Pirellulales bacterium]|nr:hypothetical protein [Pirellulales bacterium]
MRTFRLMAALVVVSAAAARVAAQAPLPGPPPQPQELLAPDNSLPVPNGAAPMPPAPGVFVPPDGSRYVPPAQTAPTDNQATPTYRQPVQTYSAQSPADTGAGQQPAISPNNPERWRYVYRNGGWWYYTPTKQWMYWSDGRWVQYTSPAVSNTPTSVPPPVVTRPRFNIGVGVGPAYSYGPYPYAPYPYGPYPYGYGYPYGPYGPYGYGRFGRVGVGIGVY